MYDALIEKDDYTIDKIISNLVIFNLFHRNMKKGILKFKESLFIYNYP